LLLTVGIFAVFVSCGEKDGDRGDPAKNTETAEVTAAVEDIYPYPEHDFGGAALKILARRDGKEGEGQDYDDLYVESEIGESLNDAVYRRNAAVEHRYNFAIDITYNADPSALTAKNIKADDNPYHIVQEKLMYLQSNLATNNYLLDMRKIGAITLEAPWYNQNAIKDLSILKKVTAIGGDMTISDKSGVMVTIFNKKFVVDNGLEDMYKIVGEGKWTLDKLRELMQATSRDLNGDGKMTLKDDQWGLKVEPYAGWFFSVSSGSRLADLDENGIPYLTLATPKYLSDLEKIMDIMFDKDNRAPYGPTVEDYVDTFTENRNFIQVNSISTLLLMRAMDDDYGLIPLPKYDETQKDYLTAMSPWASRFVAIPTTCREAEMVGAIIDAMSRESVNTVMPAYYDNLLHNKIARDEESIEMLKMIFSTVVYDLGSVYDWNGMWGLQARFIEREKRDYVSYYEKSIDKIQQAIEKTVEQMQNSD